MADAEKLPRLDLHARILALLDASRRNDPDFQQVRRDLIGLGKEEQAHLGEAFPGIDLPGLFRSSYDRDQLIAAYQKQSQDLLEATDTGIVDEAKGQHPSDTHEAETGAGDIQPIIAQILEASTSIEDLALKLVIPVEAGVHRGFRFPERTYLLIDFGLRNLGGTPRVVPDRTRAALVDAAGRPAQLDGWSRWLVRLDGLRTTEEDGRLAIVADLRVFLGMFPTRWTMIADLPLTPAELVEAIRPKRAPTTAIPAGTKGVGHRLPIQRNGWRFKVEADIANGKIALGAGSPSFEVVGDDARARVKAHGSAMRFVVQIDTRHGDRPGAGVALDGGGFKTAASDLHVRIAVDRRRGTAGRMHRFGFDTSHLRGLRFKDGERWVPEGGVDLTLESAPAAPGLPLFDERYAALIEAARARKTGVPPGEAPFSHGLWSFFFVNATRWQDDLRRRYPALGDAPNLSDLSMATDARDLTPLQAWADAITQDLNEAFLEHGHVIPAPDFMLSTVLSIIDPDYDIEYALDGLQEDDGRISRAKVHAFLWDCLLRARREAFTATRSEAIPGLYSELSGRDIAEDSQLVAAVDRRNLSSAVPGTYNWVWSIDPEDSTTVAEVRLRLERMIRERFGPEVSLENLRERVAHKVGQGGAGQPVAIPAGQVFGFDALFHGGLKSVEQALSATLERFQGQWGGAGQAGRHYTERGEAIYRAAVLGNTLECASYVVPAGMQDVVRALQAQDGPAAEAIQQRLGIEAGTDLGALSTATLQRAATELRAVGHTKLEGARRDLVALLGELMDPNPARGIVMMDYFLLDLGTRLKERFANDAQVSAGAARLLDSTQRKRVAVNLFATANALQHVYKHLLAGGWAPITGAVDLDVRTAYPELAPGDGVDRLMPRADFGCLALTLGTGRAVTDCLVRSLRDVRLLYADVPADNKPPIGFNFWSFQADELETHPSGMVSRLVAEIKATAHAGHAVVIKVDGKNSPSQAGLPNLIADLKAAGLYPDRALVLPWFSTSPETFAHGTHGKDAIMPIGAFELDLNVAESYVRWTGTSHMLLGADAIKRRARDYARSLRQDFAPLADPAITKPDDLWAPFYLDDDGRPLFDIEATAAAFEQRYDGASLPAYDPRGPIGQGDDPASTFVGGGDDVRVQVFETRPGDLKDEAFRETVAMLKAMRPGQTWRAVNAYVVIPSPIEQAPLGAALLDAIKRGVNIDLLSNSEVSIDDPSGSGPVLKSLFLLAEKVSSDATGTSGTLRLFLPKDHNTRHNKFAFGGSMMISGSYNHHPRSFTLEHELIVKMIGREVGALDSPDLVREFLSGLFDDRIDHAAIEQLAAVGFDTKGMAPGPITTALAERLLGAVDPSHKLMALRTQWFRDQVARTIVDPMIVDLEAAAAATRAKQLKLVDAAIAYFDLHDHAVDVIMSLPFPEQLHAVRAHKDAWLDAQAELSRDVHGPALTGFLLFLGYARYCEVITVGQLGADGQAIVGRGLVELAERMQRLGRQAALTELAISVF